MDSPVSDLADVWCEGAVASGTGWKRVNIAAGGAVGGDGGRILSDGHLASGSSDSGCELTKHELPREHRSTDVGDIQGYGC
ncbi:hypothetical protein SprV_0301145700 [Sparganum proliferum]